jgi:UDP-N-acetylglucosamine--N-acetylmuramyl-(pentapeptide) pyrophosphoryl-undecaprenol N-acetylglucosamine transferase
MLRSNKNNLLLTGGHAATTAVAVIEEIKSQNKGWKLYWIGVKNAIEGKKITTLESEALPRLGVKFLPLTTGRIQRRFTLWTIPSLLKIPIGFAQSVYYLLTVRPKAVLSFGGFASYPVVLIAKIFGIPVIIHEQTSAAGRANLASAKFASVVALSREDSLKYFPKAKCIVTGNPVMKEIKNVKPKFKLSAPPVIFITGGSRGSQNINMVIEKILRSLLTRYKVIHQTGGLDYLKFADIKQKLPQALRDNYEVFIRVNPLEVYKIYSKADVVVGRAGANTVSEIMTVGRPAILIPLPISYLDEQTENAKIAKKWGIARIISQDKLTPEKLSDEIDNLISDFNKIVNNVRSKESPDSKASQKLVSVVGDYMK